MRAMRRTEGGGQQGRWRARGGLVVGVATYLLLWAVAGLEPRDPSDLDIFFVPSARIAAHAPLLAYSLRVPGYQIPYPNANGPLSLPPLTLIVVLLQHFGWLDILPLRHAFISAVFAVCNLLLAWEGGAAIARLRAAPVSGPRRLLSFSAFALTPLIWLSLFAYGHIEHPLSLWLTLWGLRTLLEARTRRAGLLLGLSVLARTTAIIYLLALVVLLFGTRRRGEACQIAGAAVVTMTLGLLPFALADGPVLLFSLVTYGGALPLSGGSFLALTAGTPLEGIARGADGLLVLAAVAGICALALTRLGTRLW